MRGGRLKRPAVMGTKWLCQRIFKNLNRGGSDLTGMGKSNRHHHKRKPSAYQKQIRFLTILSVVAVVLVLLGVLWLINRSR